MPDVGGEANTREEEESKLRRLLPKEVELFKSGKMNTGAFLKDHIKSMLFILFQTHPPKSGPGSRKVEWLKMLLNATQKDPSKVDSYTPTAADSVSVELLPPPSLPNANAQWLYERCAKSRANEKLGDEDHVPQALVLADVALNYDEDENYSDKFFSEFNRDIFPKRDMDLIMDPCGEKLKFLIQDDGLTADELNKLAP